jgi:hypothetical protein
MPGRILPANDALSIRDEPALVIFVFDGPTYPV